MISRILSIRNLLFRIEFDNELFLNGSLDLVTLGKVYNLNRESVTIYVEPCGNGSCRVSLYYSLDLVGSTSLFAYSDLVACLKKVGSDVYAMAVNLEMTMTNELTSFCTRRSIACSVNYIVKTAFENAEKVCTCHTLCINCHLIIMTELMLCNSVESSCSLLSAEMKTIFGRLLTSLAVLTGSISSYCDSTLFRITTFALEEQFLSFAAALSAYCSSISCHL
jgi:hypothetical protein